MIIAIAHQKGGVGKSTLTFNLAYYLRSYSPVLIDLDIQNTITYANRIRGVNKEVFNIKAITNENELKNMVKLSNRDNLIIIDTGGFDSSLNRISIIAADMIITPVSDKLFELLGLKKFEGILQELSKIKNNIVRSHVLLNNINPSVRKLEDLNNFINSSSSFVLLDTIIRQRADIVHSSSKGLAVEEWNAYCKANTEYKALAQEIEKIIFKKYY